jgi:hypothetical protein
LITEYEGPIVIDTKSPHQLLTTTKFDTVLTKFFNDEFKSVDTPFTQSGTSFNPTLFLNLCEKLYKMRILALWQIILY